ncbi:MFS general substrate transporter [Viridothelium virens]|uniref:MFS general substrate transporter n=1 Tax=Viridothelium virens TaxID=1048519 RepID=A0A6A6GSR0_VIRVR|nr:MFS general substrate transporter [Viridothelium virens]
MSNDLPPDSAASAPESPPRDSVSQTEPSLERNGLSTEKPEEEQQPDITGLKRALIIMPITLVYFLIMLDGAIVSTAIPQITDEFKSLLDVGWYGSAYQLASSAFVPLAGKIFTYFSTKWSFLVFFTIFELGSALCGAAQSSPMLIVGRSIAGLGASGLMNGILTILAAILPPHKIPRVMGINVALGQIGLACGPLIGGALTEYSTWRWCFYINLPIGAVVGGILILLRVPELKPKPPVREVLGTAVSKMDLLGLVLLWPAAIMFFLALQWGGNQYAWDNSRVIGLFVGAAVTFAVFLAWEYRRGDDALMPYSMLRVRVIYSASATMFFFMGVMFIEHYWLPIYFQAVKNNSPLMSGVHLLPTIIAQVIFAMSSGVLTEKLGYYLPWVLSGTALSTIGYGLLSLFNPTTSTGKWIGYQVLYGVGNGAAASGSYIAIQNTVPGASIPTAMAILILCQNLGAAIWLTLAQTAFSNSLHSALKKDAPGVNAEAITAGGARMIRDIVSAEQLPGVLRAYSKGVDATMYLGIGIGVLSFVCAWGLGWKDIRKKT